MDGIPKEERKEEEAPRVVDTTECMEKLKKYRATYAWRLKAKYFSKKTFNGGDVFDHETTVDNEVIKSSRWPCTRSFANSIQAAEGANGSTSSVPGTSNNPARRPQSR